MKLDDNKDEVKVLQSNYRLAGRPGIDCGSLEDAADENNRTVAGCSGMGEVEEVVYSEDCGLAVKRTTVIVVMMTKIYMSNLPNLR